MPDQKYTSNAEVQRQQLMKGVTDSGEKLAELLGARAKQERGAEIEASQREADVAAAQQLRGQVGPDAPIHVGSASIGAGRDPLQQLGIGLKMTDDQRLETKAVQDEFNRLAGPLREKHRSFADIDSLLNMPPEKRGSNYYAQLQTALARLKEKGAMSEGDVQRGMKRTIKSDAAGLVNYFRPGTIDPMVQGQEAEIKQIVEENKKSIAAQLAAAEDELGGRAQYLAPTLHRTGSLPKVTASLGVGTGAKGEAQTPAGKQVVRTGKTKDGRSVVQYSDGTKEYK